MSPKTLTLRQSLESCTLQLQSWTPFCPNSNLQTLDSDSYNSSKRPCLSDRAKTFPLSVDALYMSRLTLFDDEKPLSSSYKKERFRWMARKRRRRRSVSDRSTESIGGRTGLCCSDFMVAAGGTDSSGEANWSSDVSDARISRREQSRNGEREIPVSGLGFDARVSESGYGSEPGHRGDVEFGYEGEVDEEDNDAWFLLWRDKLGDLKEVVGENSFAEQKVQCRGRRKKNDLKTCHSMRCVQSVDR